MWRVLIIPHPGKYNLTGWISSCCLSLKEISKSWLAGSPQSSKIKHNAGIFFNRIQMGWNWQKKRRESFHLYQEFQTYHKNERIHKNDKLTHSYLWILWKVEETESLRKQRNIICPFDTEILLNFAKPSCWGWTYFSWI